MKNKEAEKHREITVFPGSFVNAGAITAYIRHRNPEILSLVCMGYSCAYPTHEDTFLAEYIQAKLEYRHVDFENMVERLKRGAGSRFFTPEKQKWAPSADFGLCLNLDCFNFILKVEQENERNYLKMINL